MGCTSGTHIELLNPAFYRAYTAYAGAVGIELGIRMSVTSGARTYAEQLCLYRCYQNRDPQTGRCRGDCTSCNTAAPPGRSNHERGLAIDHAPSSTPAMRSIAARFRLVYRIAGEMWHVEPENLSNPWAPPLPAPPPPPQDGDEMPLELIRYDNGIGVSGYAVYSPSSNIATMLDTTPKVNMWLYVCHTDPTRCIDRTADNPRAAWDGISAAVKLRTDGRPYGA